MTLRAAAVDTAIDAAAAVRTTMPGVVCDAATGGDAPSQIVGPLHQQQR